MIVEGFQGREAHHGKERAVFEQGFDAAGEDPLVPRGNEKARRLVTDDLVRSPR
jgi:hypothetical protein